MPPMAVNRTGQFVGGVTAIAQTDVSAGETNGSARPSVDGQVGAVLCRWPSARLSSSGRYNALRTGRAQRRWIKGNATENARTTQRCPRPRRCGYGWSGRRHDDSPCHRHGRPDAEPSCHPSEPAPGSSSGIQRRMAAASILPKGHGDHTAREKTRW